MDWKPTACILCSINCGLQVQTDGQRITKIKGDRAHPGSRGYLCEKAQHLDRYQNARDRLTSPLRRRPDGTFEAISWDTAIADIAARLGAIREDHGGESIFYYGGGGQGNHLGGALYGRTLLGFLGSVFSSNALAQEKTGEFWVDGRLFGKSRCHTCGDFEEAEVAVFWGKNPWQSHGFPRARVTLKAIANDPDRALVVVDPRRSETARMADHHLQVRPGGDAYLLGAMLACLLSDDLLDRAFLDAHGDGLDVLTEALATIDVADFSARCGVPLSQIREVADLLGTAGSVSIFEDLGIQQAPHSTLNSYLEKLLYLLTGNFSKRGGMNIHTGIGSLGGSRQSRGRTTPVTGQRVITGLIPANIIPDEILTDHPDRFRAMIVESANPAHSLADSQRMRLALRALDLVVVIDVAMTETAHEADYVLPAATQYEKWEATFFTLEFPDNVFHLRRPLFEPLAGTLPEPEIHARLLEAMGALDDLDLAALHAAAAQGQMAYGMAFLQHMADPRFRDLAPIVLYRTMGPLLPAGAQGVSAVWLLAQRCARVYPDAVRRAGIEAPDLMLGTALFEAILGSPSGLVFTVDEYPVTLARIETPNGRIQLAIPELLEELATLGAPAERAAEWPMILSAGERRSGTTNTLFRDPSVRSGNDEGLRVSHQDAAALGLTDGGWARLTTASASVVTSVEVTDMMQPGHVSLPNGHGLLYPDDAGDLQRTGVAPNELTCTGDRDWLAGTPWHKHIPARVEAAETP